MYPFVSPIFLYTFVFLIRNPKVVQISFKAILGSEAGVHEESFFTIPFFKSTIVEQLQVILNNKRDNVMLQTLLKEDQAAYTAISVLEGMDTFKNHMEGYDVLKGLRRQCILVCQQLSHFTGNIFGKCGVITANLIGQLLVVTHNEPILTAVTGAGL